MLTFALTLSGCGAASGGTKLEGKNNVQSVIEEQIAKEDASSEALTTEETTQSDADALKAMLEEQLANQSEEDASSSDASDKTEKVKEPDPNVDIDLTAMSSDMVYSTVYQLMADADSYVGKKIKLRGDYYASWYEDTKQYYHYAIIQDATACCQQGMEFVWGDGSHVYPDEYPEEMAEIEVVGIFETYKDNPDDEYQYCRLRDATMVVCNDEVKE